ncbi:response regulator [Nesterenkonia sp. PF2B19]|uniref:response regulator n=1 Tax=unclassified Nesterenkonia TaxID=2629769 RepID=UPI00087337DA|nr:response regulator transcription factor [Nesterenkonia sp. PF2B19]OSM42869.1 hypothetical protein BCY76_011805 [Nesterenkonia sp. PF2B19]
MAEAETTRVLIVDDHALVRDALRLYLMSAEDMDCVGEAADGAEAVEQVADLTPHVVLMDIQMPRVDGVAAAREIRRRWPEVAVLALSTFSAEHRVVEILRAGAVGYLIKDARKDRILDAVRQAREGAVPLSARVAELLALSVLADRSAFEAAVQRAQPVPQLPPREREALGLAARGLNNAEMAAAMTVTERTIKAHMASLCRRLGVRDRVQLVIRAFELGIVEPQLGR